MAPYRRSVTFLGNESVLHVPLLERKELLRSIFQKEGGNVRFVDYIRGHGQHLFRHCCDLNMEGIISKRFDSVYVSGKRSDDWLKVKNPLYYLVRTGDPDYFDRKQKRAA